ncbi:thiopeptide-type bacteriocin biosynthesis protein [Rossellomorea sp. FS2]|uniref:thiopeptide-type bacteriocin biosynthesis protein n=1 Tax=Rossellomorea sp. FS2 TaxID=3391447 RepID=UPI003A4DF80F
MPIRIRNFRYPAIMEVNLVNWHSYHIFIHDMSEHDRFLQQVVRGIVDDTHVSSFFFIRYWQGGPHIRFRFQSEHANEMISEMKQRCRAFFRDYQPPFTLEREAFYSRQLFDGTAPDDAELYWMEDGAIKEIPYEPELERYGGEDVMAESEAIFHQSSLLALKHLEGIAGPAIPKRLLLACDFFIDMLRALTEEEGHELIRRYNAFWSRFDQGSIDPVQRERFRTLYWKQRAMGGQSGSLELDRISQIVEGINGKGKRNLLPYLIFSHVHMYNNRIGLPPNLESTVAMIAGSEKEGAVAK